ncbi:MAG: Lyzozyme M1 (1,4-beta-N-acetylmuramidase), partial [Ruminococcus sp.]|nr:Lyzozyme M1 (1,4-beta-N-acetylmuramidase) [Ruminococcus sp.]
MATNGIDISEWQGIINWQEVKTDFCIIRAGYGRLASQRDKFFDENYNSILDLHSYGHDIETAWLI